MSLRVLSLADLPAAKMERVIVHWTGGPYNASELDREHYHFLVEGDGDVIKGDHSVKSNEVVVPGGNYAAHTLGCNTRSIGISACCMLGAQEGTTGRPLRAGSNPMKQTQWEKLALVAADLCEHYDIPVTRETVLGHGEVQKNLGIPQRQKWDPMALPWDTNFQKPANYAAVGDMFRARVRAALKPVPNVEISPEARVLIRNEFFPAILEDGSSWGALKAMTSKFGWKLVKLTAKTSTVQIGTEAHVLDFINDGGTGYVQLVDLAKALDLQISWDPISRTIKLD
jgi:hypothetical protein